MFLSSHPIYPIPHLAVYCLWVISLLLKKFATIFIYTTNWIWQYVQQLQGYLKIYWTNTRLVCTHLNVFLVLNLMAIKWYFFLKFWPFACARIRVGKVKLSGWTDLIGLRWEGVKYSMKCVRCQRQLWRGYGCLSFRIVPCPFLKDWSFLGVLS